MPASYKFAPLLRNRGRLCLAIVVLPLLALNTLVVNVCADEPTLLDKVQLRNGGTIEGVVKEAQDGNRRFYIVETPDGVVIRLRNNQVKHVIRPTDTDREYLKRRSETPDSVEGHWELQQWCAENKLHQQREYHWQRIIQLDPDHKDARLRLGYKDHGGVWVHYDQLMQANGYVKDSRGIYRLPEGKAIVDTNDEIESARKKWTSQLSSWIKRVRRNDGEAWNLIAAVSDPLAVAGLVESLKQETELPEHKQDLRLQALLVETLGDIQSYEAQNALITIAMSAPRDIAERCVNQLKKPHFNRVNVVTAVSPYLNPKPATPNHAVTRAAWLAGEMEHPSAIRPLIDALVTTHLEKSPGGGGNLSISKGNNGIGFNPGAKPQSRPRDIRNGSALTSLKRLTGKNFEYDEVRWLDWFIRQNSLTTYQLNRDE